MNKNSYNIPSFIQPPNSRLADNGTDDTNYNLRVLLNQLNQPKLQFPTIDQTKPQDNINNLYPSLTSNENSTTQQPLSTTNLINNVGNVGNTKYDISDIYKTNNESEQQNVNQNTQDMNPYADPPGYTGGVQGDTTPEEQENDRIRQHFTDPINRTEAFDNKQYYNNFIHLY
jgi:hypothetical protein